MSWSKASGEQSLGRTMVLGAMKGICLGIAGIVVVAVGRTVVIEKRVVRSVPGIQSGSSVDLECSSERDAWDLKSCGKWLAAAGGVAVVVAV